MLINIVSLLLVLLEISIAGNIISGIVMLPYYLFLIEKWEKWVICPMSVIIFIHLLQNESFFRVLGAFLVITIIYYIVLQYLNYEKENILFFSIIQIIILYLLFRKNITIAEIIINFVGLNITNYIYIAKSRGNSGTL